MHYYQFNIADYRKDTTHLSRFEHGIYRDLIDWYYLDEAPIPLETQSVMRRLRLVTDEEAKALQNVLSDFFIPEDGWHHKRIDLDIVEYHAMAEKNRTNGKLGGRPKKTQSVPSGNPDQSQINPNQEPITNNQVNPLVASKLPTCPQKEILAVYAETLPELPQPRVWEGSRSTNLSARWRWVLADLKSRGKPNDPASGIEFFRRMFSYIRESDFLMGRSGDWSAELGWIVKAENFAKIIQGNYVNKEKAA